MVIGERFAWAHLPKTGGTATLELFRLFPELIVFADFDDSNAKHTLFHEREEQVRGKHLVMNIRRLPFWVLSRAQHVARWGVYPDYEPIPMATAEELSESDFPDNRLAMFTDNGRFQVDTWLRMEHLADDFLTFISAYTSVNDEHRAAAHELPMLNSHDYDRELVKWFSAEQIDRLYARNPAWDELERRLYGDRLSLGAVRSGASL
jgi:hypothetical protein